MYSDFSPEPHCRAERVLVLENGDADADAVIEVAQDESATTNDGEDEIFWIVFADEPRRVWDFTEHCLRREVSKRAQRVDQATR